MSINGAQFVALAKAALRFCRHARHWSVAQLADREPRRGKVVMAPAQGRLPSASIGGQQQRMQVNPSPSRRDELDTVWSPIRLDHVTELLKSGQHRCFAGRIEIDVEIPMGTSLASRQCVDAPATLQPVPAANIV